jgi:hypothetical protein
LDCAFSASIRILRIDNLAAAEFTEVAWFDTLPANDRVGRFYFGAWNVYPFFDNGTLLVSDTRSGLFMLRANLGNEFRINAGLNDAWFNLATDGQGFLITVFPDRKEIFLAWFTFDTERPPEDVTALLGEPGHRWLTAQGPYDGDTANLTIFMTEGGVFDAAEPAASTDPAGDGSMTIEFADCENGLVNYEITSLDISGVIPIQRITPDNVAYTPCSGDERKAEPICCLLSSVFSSQFGQERNLVSCKVDDFDYTFGRQCQIHISPGRQMNTIRITMLRQLFTARAFVTCVLVFLLNTQLSADTHLIPPEQDFFLRFHQTPDFCCGGSFARGGNEIAWIEAAPDLAFSNALTVETWILWEAFEFEEAQAVSGLDMDRATLFCGQKAYGFHYRFQRALQILAVCGVGEIEIKGARKGAVSN